jgi:uncharacterized protein Smg (DUF494 family)
VSRGDERDPVQRVLAVLARHLQAYIEGDELAFESLGEAFEQAGLGPEDLEAARMMLRGMAGEGLGATVVAVDDLPAAAAHRVLSPEERESLSPEAWGFLLALRERGDLAPRQFERVLDCLAGLGVRPVDVDLAREVATEVALRDDHDTTLFPHGDRDIPH